MADREARFEVFGRAVALVGADSPALQHALAEMALYGATQAEPNLTIGIHQGKPPRAGRNNPSQHWERDDGFLAGFGGVWGDYQLTAGRIARIDLYLPRSGMALGSAIRRMRNRQYATASEAVGQRLHEVGLLFALYSDPERWLLHAAGLRLDGGAVLVGGTGGSGKTTLELEMGLRRGAGFLTDDFAVLGTDGEVYPNLAFPKVYAYNVSGDDRLREAVFSGRGPADRAAWHVRSAVRGPSAVRRRVSPATLYGPPALDPAPLRRYVILSRRSGAPAEVRRISGGEAAAISMAVMRTEHAAIHRHLEWHAFNRRVAGQQPVIDLAAVLQRWERQAASVLEQVDCLVAEMPVEMPHATLRDELARVVSEGG